MSEQESSAPNELDALAESLVIADDLKERLEGLYEHIATAHFRVSDEDRDGVDSAMGFCMETAAALRNTRFAIEHTYDEIKAKR